MLRRLVSYLMCACVCLSLAACSGRGVNKPAGDSMNAEGSSDTSKPADAGDAPKPILDADATDEELLEVLGDEVHVVADGDYDKMVKEFQEHTEEYAGQIYQLEGVYTAESGSPCIAKSLAGGQEASGVMPLKYLTQELEEGARIRVTGIVNEGEVEGKTVPLLEAIVVEPLEGQGAPKSQEG